MTGPNTQYLISLAEELSKKIDNTTGATGKKSNLNVKFEAQREFGRTFFEKLRRIYGELMGDLMTLKERAFDPNMYHLADQVKRELEKILRNIKENRPHEGGWEFVNYVLEKPNRDIIDNLDFLAKHHLQATHEQTEDKFGLLPTTRYVEVNSFQHLRELAHEIKNYMEQHPPLPVPSSMPPPSTIGPATIVEPALRAPPFAVTSVET